MKKKTLSQSQLLLQLFQLLLFNVFFWIFFTMLQLEAKRPPDDQENTIDALLLYAYIFAYFIFQFDAGLLSKEFLGKRNYASFGYFLLSISLIGTLLNLLPLVFPTFSQLTVFQIALPLHVHLFNFILLSLATPLFWCSQNWRGQFLLFNFEDDRVTRKDPVPPVSTVLLYAALFYLLPSAEFYFEVAYFPHLKSSSVWTFGVSAAGGSSDQLHFVAIMATGCFVFCTMVTLFSAAYFLRASLLLNAGQLSDLLAILELVMHISSQFLIRNPFSLLLVVIVWSVWKYISPMPIDDGVKLHWGKEKQLLHSENRLLSYYFPNNEMQQEKVVQMKKEVKELVSAIDVEALKTKVNNSV